MSDAARSGAMLFVENDYGTLDVSGSDARSWLNGLVTCDVLAVGAGAGAWGLALNKVGKVLGELLVVANGADGLYVGVSAGKHQALVDHFSRFLIMEDAELTDVSSARGWLALHGPESLRIATGLEVAYPELRAGKIDVTGLGGVALSLPKAQLAAVCADLEQRGAERVAAAQWERLRVERLVPLFGTDYSEQDNAHESGLERRAVSWTKGCYLGQEVVCMQEMRGKVKRRVVGLRLGPRPLPARGAPVFLDDKQIGHVSSVAHSELLGEALALGLLERAPAVALEGANVTVGSGDEAARASIFLAPL